MSCCVLKTIKSVFSRVSEIPCLLTRVITNTKGSVCPAAIRGEVGPSTPACGDRADPGRENKAMHLA